MVGIRVTDAFQAAGEDRCRNGDGDTVEENATRRELEV